MTMGGGRITKLLGDAFSEFTYLYYSQLFSRRAQIATTKILIKETIGLHKILISTFLNFKLRVGRENF